MECNKQEAIRAKEIAEKKMQSKDFMGAQKFALRAQTLYPDLDNISQIITVCEVHCSSEKYIFGNEKDWYSILKIEHTADETSIKKQYRKLALLLHPDKNNFAGATDAFKLIGEAQRVLLDPEKRKSHDFKHRATRSFAPVRPSQHHAYKNSNSAAAAATTWHPGNTRMNTNGHFSSFNSQTASSDIKETFWTSCPFCGIRYQYYKDLLNRLLQCQQCQKSFTAYEVRGGANLNPMSDFLKKGKTSKQKSGGVYSTVKLKKNDASQNGTTSGQTKGSKDKKTVGSPKASNIKEDKAGKRKTESSGTTESESSNDTEETLEGDLDADDLSKQNDEDPSLRRRSTRTRSKRNISYQENMSDDDDYVGSLKKKMKSGGQRHQESINLSSEDSQQTNKEDDSDESAGQAVKEDDVEASSDTVKEDDGKASPDTVKEDDRKASPDTVKEDDRKAAPDNVKEDDGKTSPDTVMEDDGKAPSDTSSDEKDDPQVYTCADPEFNDFDSIRKEDCFAVGQVWACYDDVDAMPRFYCRISKVISPGFKLRIMWLEPDPFDDDEDPNVWENDEFPVSCGIFKRGKYEFTEEIFMFSHLIHIEKGIRRDRFKVYPMKGETWALFKNCVANATVGNKYEYEFVEVLSDYNQESGISVGPLAKVKDFTCLYNRTTTNEELDSFQVVPSKLYRFSHMVPSFKMSGTEREGVPVGSFELDPASLSTNPDDTNDPSS